MNPHTYHKLFDDDSGKWLVLNEEKKMVAGPFQAAEEADKWIARQYEIQQRTDS